MILIWWYLCQSYHSLCGSFKLLSKQCV